MNTRWGVLLASVVNDVGHLRQVKLDITDLPEELILVDVPIGAVATGNVRVTINQSDSGEVGRADNCRPLVGVSNKLGEVVSVPNVSRYQINLALGTDVLDDRTADEIGARLPSS